MGPFMGKSAAARQLEFGGAGKENDDRAEKGFGPSGGGKNGPLRALSR